MVTYDEGRTPPGRGARMSRQMRRAQLLRAAQEVFVEAGYHAAAMDDIAERAGVSKPVLYQHFPGKMELYLALLDDANEQISEAVVGALNGATTDEERVCRTMEAYFRFVSADNTPYRLVFESDLTNDPAVKERLDAVERALAEAVAPLMVGHTQYDQCERSILATALVGMAQQSARYWLAQGQPMPLERAARMVAGLAMKGVEKLPRTHDDVDAIFDGV